MAKENPELPDEIASRRGFREPVKLEDLPPVPGRYWQEKYEAERAAAIADRRRLRDIEEAAARAIPALVPEEQPRPQGLSDYESQEAARIIYELAARRIEALRLYEPLPIVEEFHECQAKERLLRGSNRAGKTLGAAVEVARAVTGQDAWGKYPKENGRAILVGKDGRHVGETMWRKLGRAGAYRIIRDRKTGLWRTFRPWEPDDEARRLESRPAPPLIPPRMIRSIAWEDKKRNQPSMITLTTGWEMVFFSSNGKPPQGVDVDLAWFDEEILDPEWYTEVAARLVDRNGRFIWSATPQASGEQLYFLHEKSERECEDRVRDIDRTIMEFVTLIDDNPHLTEDQRQEFASKLMSDEERRIRIGGEFAILSTKVYPDFAWAIHGVDPFEMPSNWSLYAVVDPGRQTAATLFAAVPPPSAGDFVYLWDELYIKNCDAEKFAAAFDIKARDKTFVAFLIDGRYGRQTESGSGKTVEQHYSDGLRARGIASIRTGSSFTWGSDDREGGILAVKNIMRVREDGTPRLRVFRNKLRNFDWEIKRYLNRRVNGIVLDEPVQRNNHLMDCLRYLAAYNPKWVPEKPGDKRKSPAVRAMDAKRDRRRSKEGMAFVNLGPGGQTCTTTL